MSKLHALMLAAVLALLASSTAAEPNQGGSRPCHNAAAIAKILSNQYDEAPVAFGLQSNGNLLQVYSSTEKETWTVVSTTPNGVSCVVAAGKLWQSLPYISKDPLA